MMDFSFLCTFVPESVKSTDGTIVPQEQTFQELSLPGTFAPVEHLPLRSECSKNFHSYKTFVPSERISLFRCLVFTCLIDRAMAPRNAVFEIRNSTS